jgi:hypothetical protein
MRREDDVVGPGRGVLLGPRKSGRQRGAIGRRAVQAIAEYNVRRPGTCHGRSGHGRGTRPARAERGARDRQDVPPAPAGAGSAARGQALGRGGLALGPEHRMWSGRCSKTLGSRDLPAFATTPQPRTAEYEDAHGRDDPRFERSAISWHFNAAKAAFRKPVDTSARLAAGLLWKPSADRRPTGGRCAVRRLARTMRQPPPHAALRRLTRPACGGPEDKENGRRETSSGPAVRTDGPSSQEGCAGKAASSGKRH